MRHRSVLGSSLSPFGLCEVGGLLLKGVGHRPGSELLLLFQMRIEMRLHSFTSTWGFKLSLSPNRALICHYRTRVSREGLFLRFGVFKRAPLYSVPNRLRAPQGPGGGL